MTYSSPFLAFMMMMLSWLNLHHWQFWLCPTLVDLLESSFEFLTMAGWWQQIDIEKFWNVNIGPVEMTCNGEHKELNEGLIFSLVQILLNIDYSQSSNTFSDCEMWALAVIFKSSSKYYERLTLWTPINFFPISARQMTTLYPIPTLNPYLYYS